MNLLTSEAPHRPHMIEPAGAPARLRIDAFAPPRTDAVRYCDQPTSLKARLLGIGGVSLIATAVLTGALFTWTTYHAVSAPPPLSVFDVAPPAAPPEPVSEDPPDRERQERKEPQVEPEQPRIEPPLLMVPGTRPIAQTVAQPVVDPGPPVEKTTAPESKPLPPAPQQTTGEPTWEGQVLGALNKVRRYPRMAQARRQQGVPYIRFVMDRDGRILSARLERSSGFPDLDREALALPRRAQPLPKPPEDRPGETLELVVPVEFFVR